MLVGVLDLVVVVDVLVLVIVGSSLCVDCHSFFSHLEPQTLI